MKMVTIIISIFLTSHTFAGEIFDQNQSFLVERYPHEFAIGDLNNDGLNDIAVLHRNRIRQDEAVMIFYQTKWGDFSEPIYLKTPGVVHAWDIKIADVNRDRHDDLLVAVSYKLNDKLKSYLTVYYQNHRKNKLGKLVEYPFARGISYIRVADLNNDRRNDVVCWSCLQDPYATITVFLQNKKTRKLEKYSEFPAEYTWTMELADMDNDGEIEILATGYNKLYPSYQNEIKIYNKEGELEQTVDYRGRSSCFKVTDLDGNGYFDIVLANGICSKINVFLQNEDGFMQTDYSDRPMDPSKIEVGDINNDGLPDIMAFYVDNRNRDCRWEIRAYLQNENTEFELADVYETFDWPKAMKIADVMRDGMNDILLLTDGWSYGYQKGYYDGLNYLHAFFKNPPNPKPRHPKKPKVRGIEQAIEAVSKSGSSKALNVLESKIEKSEQAISDEVEESVPEVLNGKDEGEIILTNTIEFTDRKNTEKAPFKRISIAIFRVWAKVIELGKVYYLKNGKLEEFN